MWSSKIWCDIAINFVGAANLWNDNAKIHLKEATASSGIIVIENNRQRSSDVRRADDIPGPSRSRAELEADTRTKRRPQRRSGATTWALAHRAVADSAARDRPLRQ